MLSEDTKELDEAEEECIQGERELTAPTRATSGSLHELNRRLHEKQNYET